MAICILDSPLFPLKVAEAAEVPSRGTLDISAAYQHIDLILITNNCTEAPQLQNPVEVF